MMSLTVLVSDLHYINQIDSIFLFCVSVEQIDSKLCVWSAIDHR